MNPAGRIDPQTWMTAPATARVMQALAADGATARFVGGCVRDAVLGRGVTDIDIATEAAPERVMALLGAARLTAVPTGIDHGTVTAVVGRDHFEITTLRHDIATDGRRATVAFIDDWTADAARRDFTINALFCDPDGVLYDPTGGLADLAAGRVRFVGDARTRIEEDVLRLLRFFRFHAHYGKSPPDPEALAACRVLAPLLPGLSAERVHAELRRLLCAPDPASVLELMAANGVLGQVLPEATNRARLARLTAIEAALGLAPDAVRRLAAAVDITPVEAAALAERLRAPGAERRRLVGLLARRGEVSPECDARARGALLYRLGAATFRDLAMLGWAGAAPDAADWRALIAAADAWTDRRLPVSGSDVLALGVKRGPEVGALLAAVEDWWIAAGFTPDRAACLARLTALAGGTA